MGLADAVFPEDFDLQPIRLLSEWISRTHSLPAEVDSAPLIGWVQADLERILSTNYYDVAKLLGVLVLRSYENLMHGTR